jgi:hypothetical protein
VACNAAVVTLDDEMPKLTTPDAPDTSAPLAAQRAKPAEAMDADPADNAPVATHCETPTPAAVAACAASAPVPTAELSPSAASALGALGIVPVPTDCDTPGAAMADGALVNAPAVPTDLEMPAAVIVANDVRLPIPDTPVATNPIDTTVEVGLSSAADVLLEDETPSATASAG